ncbi:DUF6879 family protein [Thermomonospora umbrina]|uniref:DUF6879 domain-containing protein n=1 Tax=Thermomonospora umbrina TaxID=111806 RepID=A0A3D9T2W4_9ACTN|nr:hypothetical protein DFJ69_4610 [Thermomonospora umbrina]
MLLDNEAWRKHFDSFKNSAFRLETRPVYTMPGEREPFSRFLAGEPCPPTHNEVWRERLTNYRATGRTVGRVRLVRRPFTDYIRYQFAWAYPLNVQAGEDIRILDITDRGDLDLPDQDFWAFDVMSDHPSIVRLTYRPDGTQIGRELLDNPDTEMFIRYRDTALRDAVPLGQYRV